MVLSPLAPADIAEVMRLERLPGYDAFIGRWSAEEHAAEMASPDARYVGFRAGERLTGFVILQRFCDPAIRLRRIAVEHAGSGAGAELLRAVMDWVFAGTPAEAMTLDVALTNGRARRVYHREGWSETGEIGDGTHMGMAIDRAAWAELGRP
jgi:RimJ/RimL family protein N-acetyltransferase